MVTATKERQLTLDELPNQLAPPKPMPAPAETYDFKELIKREHCRAELQRLDEGWPGCGCDLCQELYKTLDLSKYGNRAARYGDLIFLSEKKRQDTDHWTADGAAFVPHCQRYGVSQTGATFCFSDDKEAATPLEGNGLAMRDSEEPVTKLGGRDLLLPATKDSQKQVVLKHPGGRPIKSGKVTRMTEWRRKRQERVLV